LLHRIEHYGNQFYLVAFILQTNITITKNSLTKKSNLFHEQTDFQLSHDQALNCESPPRPGRHTIFIDT